MDGEPREPVILRTAPNEFQAGIIVAQLEEAGIEATTSVGDSASLGVFGASGIAPTHVWVRPDLLDAAEAALEARREASIDLDWSEVDVGEPDPDDRLAVRIARGDRSEPIAFGGLGLVVLLLAPAIVLGLLGWWVAAGVLVALIVIALARTASLRLKYRAGDAEAG
jgi:hypothetical protein